MNMLYIETDKVEFKERINDTLLLRLMSARAIRHYIASRNMVFLQMVVTIE